MSAWAAAAQGDYRRRAGNRRPGADFDAVYLHRVRAGRLLDRSGALAVFAAGARGVFAMLASYLLSRTVTPTFAAFLLRDEVLLHREDELEIEDNPYSPDYERLHKEHQELQQHENGKDSNGRGKNGRSMHSRQRRRNGNGNGNGHKHVAYERHELPHRQFDADEQRERDAAEKIRKGVIWRVHTWFIRGFAKMRGRYVENLRWALEHRLAGRAWRSLAF